MLKKEFANLMPSKQQLLKAEILIRLISIAVYSITPEKVLIFAAEIDKITPFTTKHECFVPSGTFMIRSQTLLQFILANCICNIF